MSDNDTERTVSKPDWWDQEPAWMKSARESSSSRDNNSRDERDRDYDRDRDRERSGREYSRSRGSDNGELLDAINALPERLTSGLREALTGTDKGSKKEETKKDDDSDKGSEKSSQTGKTSETKESPGSRRSFADRWFN